MAQPEDELLPDDESRPKRAVAIQYEPGGSAPKVVASGIGELARRILELAERHRVPVHRDDSLSTILAAVKVGHDIPVETYRAVAEILAFLYRADEKWQQQRLPSRPKQSLT